MAQQTRSRLAARGARVSIVACILASCGAPAPTSVSPSTAPTLASLPHLGECPEQPGEPGISEQPGGAACVAPIPPSLARSGQTLFESGMYREAGNCFVLAYEQRASPPLLHNAGVSYERAGLTGAALNVYRRFLTHRTGGRLVSEVRSSIARIEASGETH